MSLTQELSDFREQFLSQVDGETVNTMNQATANLANSEIVDRSLKKGDTIPRFSLPNAVGKQIDIQSLLDQGLLVISFYRGSWCPYCNLELRALQSSLSEIQTLGANLVAISPQTPDNSLSTQEKNELTFEVLSDEGNQIAQKFGLVFTLPQELRPIYENFGINLPAHNGDDTFELPVAATYIVDREGKIIRAFVNADYTQRLDPTEIIDTLKTLTINA